MALTTSRRSVVRGAPAGTGAGNSGPKIAHSSLVRSLGYGLRGVETSMPDPPGIKGMSIGQASFCPKSTKLSRGIRFPPPLLEARESPTSLFGTAPWSAAAIASQLRADASAAERWHRLDSGLAAAPRPGLPAALVPGPLPALGAAPRVDTTGAPSAATDTAATEARATPPAPLPRVWHQQAF